MGLEIARRALAMSQLNLRVIAHNVANANTPGFSRQRAELIESPPIPYPSISRGAYPQQLGTGVDVDAIRRIRDEFLDEVIRYQTGSQGRNETVDAAIGQIELIFNEPGGEAIGTFLDDFFAAWQDLSNNPELISARASLREQTISLVREFERIDSGLKKLSEQQAKQLRIKVDEANTLARQIADLNIQISQVEGLGENPNDLLDQRDLLVEKLSEIIPVNTIEQLDGSMSVLIGGLRMVEMDHVNELEVILDGDDPNHLMVRFENRNTPYLDESGILAGLIESREEVIPVFLEKMNKLATALINRVNVQHIRGFGLDGTSGRPFFTDRRTAEMIATFDLSTTVDEDTRLDELGITAGTLTIQGQQLVLTADDVRPGEAITLGELLTRITDAQQYVRASLDHDRLGNPFVRFDLFNPEEGDTEIAILEGTSNFFDVVGLADAESVFTGQNDNYTNASDMMEFSLAIIGNLDYIAAAGDDGSGVYPGPGNNDNAILIAGLQSFDYAVEGATYTDYFASTISELGSRSQEVRRLVANQAVLLEQLDVQRESIRGVSLDEEATNLITYQRIYEGAARVTQVIDSTLDTLINRTGA